MLIPKIKLGVSDKRSKSNWSFDSQTTANIGFVQPTMARLLPPDSNINIKQRTLVRMSPLVNPTFGRLSQRDYFTFVKMSDVYHPWPEFLSGKSYTTSDGETYIPTDLPRFLLSDIVVALLLRNSYMSIAIGTDPNIVIAGSNYIGDEQGFDDDIWPKYLSHLVNYLFFKERSFSVLYPNGSSYYPADEGKCFDPFGGSTFVSDTVHGVVFAQSLAGRSKQVSKGVELVTFENCDFSYYISPDDLPEATFPSFHYSNHKGQEVVYQPGMNGLYINFRLKPMAKNIRKILLGLGLSFNPYDTILYNPFKLLAFYKSWFDSFVPQRTIQFTDTTCYKIIQKLEKVLPSDDVTNLIYSWVLEGQFKDGFYYYTQPDYFSASLYNLGDNSLDSNQINTLNSPVVGSVVDISDETSTISNPSSNAELRGLFTGLSFQLMLRLLRFTNKNNVFGRSVRDYLRVHYGIKDADVLARVTNKINSNRVDIQFDDVMNLSETESAFLGEYAGKGLGYKEAERTYFETKDFGFIFCMSVVVPESGYYQGSLREDTLYNKFDFFTEEFDALGYEVIRRGEIMNESISNRAMTNSTFDTSEGFGFIPRYSYAKVAKNIVNGDLSLHSTKNGLEGYYLDKRFSSYKEQSSSMLDTASAEIIKQDIVDPDFMPSVVSDSIRKIDPTDSIGNYNRIFQYRDVDLDHFIIQKVFDVELTAPWKSLSESFDTFSSDDNSTVEMNHQ